MSEIMNQSCQNEVEILGLELLQNAELETLVQQLEEMSCDSDDDGDEAESYANDSLHLERVTAGARRRSQRRRNSSDTYANDSVELTKDKTSLEDDEKDRLPTEMVFSPLKNDSAPLDQTAKEWHSTQLGAKDLTKLKPHSLTNRAA